MVLATVPVRGRPWASEAVRWKAIRLVLLNCFHLRSWLFQSVRTRSGAFARAYREGFRLELVAGFSKTFGGDSFLRHAEQVRIS